MARSIWISLLLLPLGAGAIIGGRALFQTVSTEPTPTNKILTPMDLGVPVGSFPANMALSPNGKYVIVTNTGFRQQLSVLDASSGQMVSRIESNAGPRGNSKEALYYGLAFHEGKLYASRGGNDKVTSFNLSADGTLAAAGEISNPAPQGAKTPNFIAGVTVLNGRLYAVNNQTHEGTGLKGSVSELDLQSGKELRRFTTGGFPFAITSAEGKLFVTSERDGLVNVIDPASGNVRELRTGLNPTGILAQGGKVFVTNAGSDTLSILNPVTERVERTVLLRPAELRGLPSCTPLSIALKRDGTAYVALADLSAVAVVNTQTGRLLGYLPVGWYPTAVVLSADESKLFVANAKGVRPRNPNGKPVGDLGTYVLNIMEGTVSLIDVPTAQKNLAALTKQTYANNHLGRDIERRTRLAFKNPGIEHVIYVIKENRTYDNVLGDLPRGKGDPSLCLFPREVTPNQHALAERFVLLDNFFVCAEVSGDGWNWSTAGMVNEYNSRNVIYNYSGRGRDYDFEGLNNDVPSDFAGVPDVNRPAGGYLWDLALRHKKTVRNYGFFVGSVGELGAKRSGADDPENAPTKRALVGITDTNFRNYDMEYPDSEAYQVHGIDAPHTLKTYGKHKAISRYSAWKREFDGYVKSGKLPQLMMLRLPRDHTSGTRSGKSSPRSMVADNDYAVGQLVETVSKSPFWKKTLICILEDDAQAGIDHVDCHRSIAFLISPYIRRGTFDSKFYNTDSMLRTIELVLGLPPMNGYDATARPIDVFVRNADNIEPYTAILPAREILAEVNGRTAYRAKDSDRLLNRFAEESVPDVILNDILWGAIKGTPLPAKYRRIEHEEDED